MGCEGCDNGHEPIRCDADWSDHPAGHGNGLRRVTDGGGLRGQEDRVKRPIEDAREQRSVGSRE